MPLSEHRLKSASPELVVGGQPVNNAIPITMSPLRTILEVYTELTRRTVAHYAFARIAQPARSMRPMLSSNPGQSSFAWRGENRASASNHNSVDKGSVIRISPVSNVVRFMTRVSAAHIGGCQISWGTRESKQISEMGGPSEC